MYPSYERLTWAIVAGSSPPFHRVNGDALSAALDADRAAGLAVCYVDPDDAEPGPAVSTGDGYGEPPDGAPWYDWRYCIDLPPWAAVDPDRDASGDADGPALVGAEGAAPPADPDPDPGPRGWGMEVDGDDTRGDRWAWAPDSAERADADTSDGPGAPDIVVGRWLAAYDGGSWYSAQAVYLRTDGGRSGEVAALAGALADYPCADDAALSEAEAEAEEEAWESWACSDTARAYHRAHGDPAADVDARDLDPETWAALYYAAIDGEGSYVEHSNEGPRFPAIRRPNAAIEAAIAALAAGKGAP